jgi:hypothetical protein
MIRGLDPNATLTSPIRRIIWSGTAQADDRGSNLNPPLSAHGPAFPLHAFVHRLRD